MMALGIYLFTKGMYPLSSLLLIAMPIMYVSIVVWRNLIYTKKLYEKDPSLKEEYSITFLENEVVYHSGQNTTALPWSSFSQFKESADYIYIYVFGRTVTIIPKRIFKSEEDLKQFRELLESKLKRSKK